MKNFILSISLLSVTFGASAQTDYYAGREYIRLSDVTYKVTDDHGYYSIEDSTNVVTDLPLRHWDGSSADPLFGYKAIPNDPSDFYHQIFWERFTEDELLELKENDEDMIIGMYISTLTGQISELRFSFKTTSPLCFIAPERFRDIEIVFKTWKTYTIPERYRDVQIIPMTKILYFENVWKFR